MAPFNFFGVLRQNGSWKIPEIPLFSFFRHCETFFQINLTEPKNAKKDLCLGTFNIQLAAVLEKLEKKSHNARKTEKVSEFSVVVNSGIGLIVILTILDMLTSSVIPSTFISQNFGICFQSLGRNVPSFSGHVS